MPKDLKRALREQKEWLELNGGYENDDHPTDSDALDDLLSECGDTGDGCAYAGTEYCDWECPFS